MNFLKTWRQVRRISRAEQLRASMQKKSNRIDELKASIRADKREILDLEQPAPRVGQDVEPQGFEVER